VGKETVARSWLPFQWTSLLIASIVVLSGVGAFAAVRAWYAPPAVALARPATLTVETQPAGVDLLIDEQPRGKTPLTIFIDPGAHALAVRAGGVERTVQLALTPGAHLAQSFDLTSAPASAPGRLSVLTDPPGARVSIDGRPRGVSPLVVEDLVAAEHMVSVTSGTASAQRAVTLSDGVAKELMFSLPRSAASLAGWMALASPFPVDVIEGGEMIGASGAKIMLAAGKHELVLRNQAFGYEERRTMNIVAGAVASVTVIPPKGRLNVNAQPWADVLIDGAAVGQTPLANIEVAAGPHEITFRHPELGERTEHIVITATRVNRTSVDLGK
jgi:hypothetical protein